MRKNKLILWLFVPFFTICWERGWAGDNKVHLIPDANPGLRHFIDLQVPTGVSIKRTGDTLDIWYDSFAHTNATVGYKMVTGWKVQPFVIHDQTSQDYGASVFGSSDLSVGTNSVNFSFTPAAKFKDNNYFEERVTFFESDVPIDSAWSAEWGHYKILWSKTFRVPINENR